MPLRSPETPDTSRPFVIRGHHLRHYSTFIQSGFTPAAYAAVQTRFIRRSWVNAIAEDNQEEAAYCEDVLGPVCGGSTDYQARIEDTMTEFLVSSGTRPLEVVTATPDTMCGAAIVGRHCVRRLSALHHQDYLDRDGERVDDFANCVKEIGHGQLLEEFAYEVEFSDSCPQRLIGVRTVLHVGRQVLNNADFNDLWHNDPTVRSPKYSIPQNEHTN